jgi:hypothetical protein
VEWQPNDQLYEAYYHETQVFAGESSYTRSGYRRVKVLVDNGQVSREPLTPGKNLRRIRAAAAFGTQLFPLDVRSGDRGQRQLPFRDGARKICAPSGGKIALIAEKLGQNTDELLALAGKVSSDVIEIERCGADW